MKKIEVLPGFEFDVPDDFQVPTTSEEALVMLDKAKAESDGMKKGLITFVAMAVATKCSVEQVKDLREIVKKSNEQFEEMKKLATDWKKSAADSQDRCKQAIAERDKLSAQVDELAIISKKALAERDDLTKSERTFLLKASGVLTPKEIPEDQVISLDPSYSKAEN